MQLHAITKDFVIYTSKNKIIAESITKDAKAVLDWYYRIPANN